MTIPDETLMAFADDELEPAARDAVAAALRDDPALASRVAQHRALRAKVNLAFAAELDETPPERLLAIARGPSQGTGATTRNVVELEAARAAQPARPAARLSWRSMTSMAASLLVGLALGFFALPQASPIVMKNGGGLVASGILARALSRQLGSERSPAAAVQIQLSFLSKSGDYCRTFTMAGAASQAGMACRHADDWQIRALAQPVDGAAGKDSSENYRTAGSALSPLILAAIQQQISGEPLDERGEMAARQRHWRPSVD